jgi:hypothetical protein
VLDIELDSVDGVIDTVLDSVIDAVLDIKLDSVDSVDTVRHCKTL